MKQSIRRLLDKTTIKAQLIALLGVTLSLVIAALIIINYLNSARIIVNQATETGLSLLKLETGSIDDYFTELERFSMLPRQSAEFTRILESGAPLSFAERTAVQSLVRAQFYSRRDLESYRLYLLDRNMRFEMTASDQKVRTYYSAGDIENDEYFKFYTQGRYYKYFKPSSPGFIVFYRTLIRIADRQPLGVIQLTLKSDFIDGIAAGHTASGELFYITDDYGRLLYSSAPDIISSGAVPPEPGQDGISSAGGKPYLILSNHGGSQPVTVHSGIPMALIEAKLGGARNISIILGAAAVALTAAICAVFVSLLTRPLYTLTRQLQSVGRGDFTATVDVGGSAEIAGLAESFNDMTQKIDELIKTNYVSELNEKTARLIALEAQTNPHFLYNTLQAISAEALENGQFRVNDMVTSLASMLRYTINAPNAVTLGRECAHVKDYLYLQQARFGGRLDYAMDIPDGVLLFEVPKLCLQMLAENSIIHGMESGRPIKINISAAIKENALRLEVSDDGAGIPPEKLEMLKSVTGGAPPGKSGSIGLANLSARLLLLYGQSAEMTIDSTPGVSTRVAITLPLKEGMNV